ncbi:MAG: hypothetical protein ACRC68_14980 [Clostridium sp.]
MRKLIIIDLGSIPKDWVNEIANMTTIEQLIEKFSYVIDSKF